MIPWGLIRRAAIPLGIIMLVGLVGWIIYDRGYTDGKRHVREGYRDLIEHTERVANEARGRAEALQKATEVINSEMERQHGQFQTALAERERAAQQRIARVVRESAARCDRRPVPPPAGPTKPPHGTPEELERDRATGERLALDIVTIGSGCEQDAATVSAWQRWYRQQRALMNPQ
jgi:hypothetical protein